MNLGLEEVVCFNLSRRCSEKAKVEMMTSRLAQISVLGSLLITFNIPSPHLEGTLLPRGFFLGLLIPTAWLNQSQLLDAVHEETLHRVSLALLMFYAGLKTDFRRIRGMACSLVVQAW